MSTTTVSTVIILITFFHFFSNETFIVRKGALMFLNEGSLLNNLKVRFGKHKIYVSLVLSKKHPFCACTNFIDLFFFNNQTYVGSILVALNPYKQFGELYDRKSIDKYSGKSLGTLPPHVFAIGTH
jgi:myosin heavy subunit